MSWKESTLGPVAAAGTDEPSVLAGWPDPPSAVTRSVTLNRIELRFNISYVEGELTVKRFAQILAAIVMAGIIVSAASAATPIVPWAVKDMKTAIRGLGYPKPNPKKLTCRGLGAAASNGRYSAFSCVATYRHHRRSSFQVEGKGYGGWLCAGKTLPTCRLLRHGFATSNDVSLNHGLPYTAELAAQGYVQNRFDTLDTFVAVPCRQTRTQAWTCAYKLDAGTVTVTITLKAVHGGYTTTAAAIVSS